MLGINLFMNLKVFFNFWQLGWHAQQRSNKDIVMYNDL